MSIHQDIEELVEVSRQLKRNTRLKTLFRFLKVLLIGFLVGRDVDRRVLATANRRDHVVRRIRKYFNEMERLLEQLEKMRRIDAFTARMSEKEQIEELLSFRNDLKFLITKKAKRGLASSGKEDFRKYDEILLNSIKEYLEQKKHVLKRQVEEIENSGTYLIYTDKERSHETIKSFMEDLEYFKSNEVLPEFCSQTQTELSKLCQIVSDYNNEFIKRRKEEYAHLFKKDHLLLDEEQKDAVVTDDKHNLVIAGAGAGKTEVLITRIAYLIKRKPDSVHPNRILAIAYQNKDVKQIEHRLRGRYDIGDVEVTTFHKLGKKVLQQAGRKFERSSIIDENKKHEIIRSLHLHKLTDPNYYRLFLQYVKTLHDDEKGDNFGSKAENLAYAQKRAYFTINNTRVKSKAEKEIMDFFLMNKLNGEPIAIDYEPDLPGFRPDFGLPKYDLFIEHWALNEKGEVPEWFDQTTEDYKEKMQLKKEWFAKNHKPLVETFAYEYDETSPDRFIELLKMRVIEKLLTRNGGTFEFTPLAYNELVEVAWGPYKDPVDEISNFVTNAKTYGLSPEKITEKLLNGKWSQKQIAFGNFALKIYGDYKDHLTKTTKIDFEDMINEAIVEMDNDKNLYSNIYDHMLIDEYQDISAQRYRLIKKLIERNPPCKLFCVGDDWQSIMAFSGSNLDFFVNFEKYFEKPAVTKISTNYRSIKTIVDTGAQLIKKNGNCQISKTTLSNRDEEKPIMVFRSPHKENYRMRYYEQIAEDCLTRIIEYTKKGFLPYDILVLSRFMRTKTHRAYKFHHVIKALLDKAQEMGIGIICDDARDESKIRVLTVHKGKGLEARAVFVLNVIKDAYGFPCEIEDSSIYAPVRENYPEQSQKEEERRLFYVAITRAKEDLIIYTWEPSKSEFLHEIEHYTKEERLNY